MPKALTRFEGEYKYLRMSHKCDVRLKEDFFTYPSIAHALFSSAFRSVEIRKIVRKQQSMADLQSMHLSLPHYEGWDKAKLAICNDLCVQKFTKPPYKNRLAKLKEVIIISTDIDLFWSWSIDMKTGLNWYGKLLMHIRDFVNKK